MTKNELLKKEAKAVFKKFYIKKLAAYMLADTVLKRDTGTR